MNYLQKFRVWGKNNLQPETVAVIKAKILPLARLILGFLYQGNLSQLAVLHQTDKYGGHYYTPIYQKHFQKLRHNKLKLLEIGVGGNENPNFGGNSLRMWKQFFWRSKITSLDIYDKKNLQEPRIKIFQGDQSDAAVLAEINSQAGPFDIIIDDGSHMNSHVVASFKILFPLLKSGGIYAVEDTQTAYWEGYGGSSLDLNKPGTSMNFFKGLTDCLNFTELENTGQQPTYFDQHIKEIHFYHNLIFIYKV